ncbi:unnamed protein product [Albugo candida]|uniref:Uncharacterized protein n=1 Tax=Albugo candida TaxID=65357 RepID=A0A024FUN3_9STRA|nr:unnamed protein product [Albugo candida]|eukprot:CCI10835.1 unnamed protein product [Albugo candida]
MAERMVAIREVPRVRSRSTNNRSSRDARRLQTRPCQSPARYRRLCTHHLLTLLRSISSVIHRCCSNPDTWTHRPADYMDLRPLWIEENEASGCISCRGALIESNAFLIVKMRPVFTQ